jgi:hypothetical protein
MSTLRREIHPQIKVIDEKAGIVEYVASNETIDSHNEIVRADGWKFNRFQKNAPFVDSHNYGSIACILGKVLDYSVTGSNLVETVQWALGIGKDVDLIADWGFKMTAAGYLKAVSVGFMPLRYCTRWDNDKTEYNQQCSDLGVPRDVTPNVIYIEHDQLELSACVIGANQDAVARAYKAGVVNDAFLQKISAEKAKSANVNPADGPAAAALTRQRAQERFLLEMQLTINRL